MAKCNICGGWARKLPRHGAHELCRAREQRGDPTPSLGDKCDVCNGTGHSGSTKSGPMLFLDSGPDVIARSIDAVFPACKQCGGRGIVGE